MSKENSSRQAEQGRSTLGEDRGWDVQAESLPSLQMVFSVIRPSVFAQWHPTKSGSYPQPGKLRDKGAVFLDKDGSQVCEAIPVSES